MLSELRVDEPLNAIGERTPVPASGAATALVAGLAADLTELSARYAGDEDDADRARTLATELVELRDADEAAYVAFMEDRNAERRAEIVRIPEEIAGKPMRSSRSRCAQPSG